MVVPFRNLRVRVSFAFLAAFLGAAVMVVAPRAAWGQATSTGTVTGEVVDNTNAIVPAATVTITLKATGTVRTTTTNNEGHYVFVDVDPGAYDIKVEKQGFASTLVANQVVQVGTQLTENVKLQVGSVSTTVTVTETAGAELQTMNSTVGNTIMHEELMNLPNIGRDATTFATLQPGTNINGNSAGAVTDQNTFQLDGGVITDDMSGDNDTYISAFTSNTAGVGVMHSPGNSQAPSGVVPTPVTSIEEFKVGVANQTADFNQGAGSQVQMVTKRGTNAFHGTVYDYYLDNNFGGANTWDNNSTGTAQPSTHYSRFGAAAGGALPKMNFLGGKWYLFGNYEGFRYPLAEEFERNYPTPLLRAGMLAFNGSVINLNPTATAIPSGMSSSFYTTYGVTAGQMIPTTACPAGACDPRGLGINPVVQTLWNTGTPLPNDPTHGDGVNYAGYKGNLSLPQTSNFGVVRLDHDFNAKNHFNATYHYYRLNRETSNQVDVGGFFPGDTFGDYQATSIRPQVPWFYTAGLTTNITSNLTNDFHYSMTRNYWAYETNGGVPNVAGFPAALEISGETSGSFDPYNTDNQDTRTRFWDGKDNMLRDDLTFIKGNHLLQFGGLYQRSWEEHQRIDNGGSVNIYEQYLLGQGTSTPLTSNINMAGYIPASLPSTSVNKYNDLYSMVLGMVDESQVLFTRGTGTTLPLNPQASCAISGVAATAGCMASPPALNQSIIPTYNLYFGDSWHIKPTLTVNYGLGYTVEMPPYSPNGAQSIPVDENGNPLYTAQYFAARQAAALQGNSYDPNIGFETIGNLPGGPKYPYNPYYKGLSPRLSAAWNFSPNSVIRGGWARIFGRLNGVDQVLVPILAPGLMQAAQCFGPTITGTCGAPGGAPPADIFRVGVDGTTAPVATPSANLPQPWYPGVNDIATGSGEGLDPTFKPNRSDEFNVSIQHQLTPKIQVEVGYIGRIIRNEYQSYDLNGVPYMMTGGGQTFANAWGNLMKATNLGANGSTIPVQPFFENALGPTSAYCTQNTHGVPTAYGSCTAAFFAKEQSNMQNAGVWDAWTDISTTGAFSFGRSMLNDPTPNTDCPVSQPTCGANGQASDIFMNASNGYGNYNAGYFQVSFFDWHGLTMKTNLTYSRALGTGAEVQATSEYTVDDPYNLHNMYGPQDFDETYSYNLYFNWAVPFYRNRNDLAGRLLGGWSISPLFVAGSGFPDEVHTTNGDCESFGEGNCNNESSSALGEGGENAVLLAPLNYSNSRKSGNDVFSNPAASFNLFRNPILGVDNDIAAAPLRGLPFWNLDVALNKQFKFTEKFSGTFSWQVTNALNHMQPADPFFYIGDESTWGLLGGGFGGAGNVQGNIPRQMEFGFHVDW